MIRARIPMLLLVSALACSCDRDKPSTATTTAAEPPKTAEPVPATKDQQPDPGVRNPVAVWTNLSTPESVLYDPAADAYLVSNVVGQPLAKDGQGFITRIWAGKHELPGRRAADERALDMKWIASGQNGVTLHAPKGMAFSGDRLYVADIDVVRIFDRKTGAPLGNVEVPGATFLNDVAAGPGGRVYVSDYGMKDGKPSGTDAVYAIDGEKLTTIAKSKDLANPNGLVATADGIWVATASGALYMLDASGKKSREQKLPKGSLDGLVLLPDGDLLVTSWDAAAVYRGKPGGELRPIIEGVASPADIGLDTKRMLLLVPLFTKDEVRAYALPTPRTP